MKRPLWMSARILPALGLALLTGCAHYQPRLLSPAQNASALQSRSFNDPEFRAFLAKNLNHDPDSKIVPWPLPKTWDLDTLLLAAFYFQPDLEVARAQWRLEGRTRNTRQSRRSSPMASRFITR